MIKVCFNSSECFYLLSRPFFYLLVIISSSVNFYIQANVISFSDEIVSFYAFPFPHLGSTLCSSVFDRSWLLCPGSSTLRPCRNPRVPGRRFSGSRRLSWGRSSSAFPWSCGGPECPSPCPPHSPGYIHLWPGNR